MADNVGGVLMGAGGGAATGAEVGSMFGGKGELIGAALGAIGGGLSAQERAESDNLTGMFAPEQANPCPEGYIFDREQGRCVATKSTQQKLAMLKNMQGTKTGQQLEEKISKAILGALGRGGDEAPEVDAAAESS